mgnify:CR=1 FL=1
MSIESFIREIESRKKTEIESFEKEFNDKKTELETKKNETIKDLSENYDKESKTRSERESARIIESGKLEAKKILFDAINKNLDSTFNIIRQDLVEYTKKSEYKTVLEQMIKTCQKRLDKKITVHCKEEDKQFLNISDITIGSSIHTLGGIIAENDDVIPKKHSLRLISEFPPEQITVKTISDAGHNDISNKMEYYDHLKSFLNN